MQFDRAAVRSPGESRFSVDTGEIRDRATAKTVRELLERDDPSPELLAFRGGVGRGWIDVTSAAINAYIKSHAGEEASAKTFRSWGATVLAARELADPECTPPRVCERVAESLGNTPTVTRDSYIDPRVFGAAENGLRLAPRFARLDPGLTRNRNAIDRAVVQLIESASAG